MLPLALLDEIRQLRGQQLRRHVGRSNPGIRSWVSMQARLSSTQPGHCQNPQEDAFCKHKVDMPRNGGNTDDSELPVCLQQGGAAESYTACPSNTTAIR